MQVLADKGIVESHDGRKVTLIEYIYKYFNLDTQQGSLSALLTASDGLPPRSTLLIGIGLRKLISLLSWSSNTAPCGGGAGHVGYVVDPAITQIYRRR